jgi:hypothetical protein
VTTEATRPAATVGLHGSASTWAFNVVRELMIAARGEEQVAAIYADEVAQLPTSETRTLIIKSHHGSVGLDAWLTARRALIILSVRDPRDCCLSMSSRFEAPLGATVRWLAADCNRLARLAAAGYPLLRYEDRFFERPEAVAFLARALGLDLAPGLIAGIFERYRTEAVRSFARTIQDMPDERVTMVGKSKMERVTQIHAPHIGDGRVGKWRDLPPAAQAEITRVFAPFLRRFGYA